MRVSNLKKHPILWLINFRPWEITEVMTNKHLPKVVGENFPLAQKNAQRLLS